MKQLAPRLRPLFLLAMVCAVASCGSGGHRVTASLPNVAPTPPVPVGYRAVRVDPGLPVQSRAFPVFVDRDASIAEERVAKAWADYRHVTSFLVADPDVEPAVVLDRVATRSLRRHHMRYWAFSKVRGVVTDLGPDPVLVETVVVDSIDSERAVVHVCTVTSARTFEAERPMFRETGLTTIDRRVVLARGQARWRVAERPGSIRAWDGARPAKCDGAPMR